ncbi:MAG: phosphotriesterase family protein [Vicinamibacteria bacterium]
MMIQTVLGPIDPSELGVCLPHEHLWCDQRLSPRLSLYEATRSPSSYMRLDDYDRMLQELVLFREAGGNAIVEVTCDGWGRDLEVLARLSEASSVHIIATAGFYVEPSMPLFVSEWTDAALADHITGEVERGVGEGKRLCGVLKSAVHRARIEGLEAKVLKAVAVAQKRTGVPITTHTTGARRQEIAGGNIGPQQLQFLKAEGVDPSRLIVGHVDERPDIDVLASLADEGCFLQFDVIGKEHWLLDQTRAELIHALIDRGYLEHLMLSQDRNREHEMRFGGGAGYCHIFQSFLPRLLRMGVNEREIHTMMVSNPARAFARLV